MGKMEERLHTGQLYQTEDNDIVREQIGYQKKLWEFNQMDPTDFFARGAKLKEMLAECGEMVFMEGPFYANFGGHNCHFGSYIYCNYHLTCVDDTHIYIGDYCLIGPNVTIATASHPIDPKLREEKYQFNMPVHIGRNVWIGAGAVICPGVTIGDNTVIGAGSIVTKDIPSNVVAYGNPCKVARPINEYDQQYYFKGRKIEL